MNSKDIPLKDREEEKEEEKINDIEDSVSVEISPEAIKASKKGSHPEGEDVEKEESAEKEDALEKEELDPREAERKKAAEYYDSLLRLKAEFENYKKRMEKERMRFAAFAKESVLLKYLPTLDNLERSLSVEGKDKKETLKKIVEGVELIYKELRDRLKEDGVERMEVIGKKFDPYCQEALTVINSPDHENDTVIEEITPGYTLNGNVLRPAKVVVAKNDSDKKIIEEP